MPIFEFGCRTCHRKTTALVRARARIGEVRCTHCGSTDLVKLVSRFAMPRSDEARLDTLSDPSSFTGIDENDPKSVAQFMKKMGREMGEDLGDDFDQALDQELSGGGPRRRLAVRGESLIRVHV
jgi:putative FmdB family regulatory protein